jgi:D-amino-acid oxidase
MSFFSRRHYFSSLVIISSTSLFCFYHHHQQQKYQVLAFCKNNNSRNVDNDGDSERELVTLIPPLLDPIEDHVLHYLPCHRPARSGGIRLEKESLLPQQDRVVFHNYGHGGAGWSTFYGCVKYVVEQLFEKEVENASKNELNKKKSEIPVAVIGSGVMGLTTAMLLYQRGYKKITIFSESNSETDDLTSHKAAGLLGVFALSSANDEKAKVIETACLDTMKFYLRVLLGGKEDRQVDDDEFSLLPPSDFVRRLPRYFEGCETSSDCGLFVQHGLMKPEKKVLVQFQKDDGTTTKPIKLICFEDAIFMDTRKIMHWMEDVVFEKMKIPRIVGKVESFLSTSSSTTTEGETSSIPPEYKYVFNCTGCGSRELAGDTKLKRNGGHLIELRNQGPNRRTTHELNYVYDIVISEGKVEYETKTTTATAEGRKNSSLLKTDQYLYFIPKGDGGVLGGSMIYDMSEEDVFPYQEFERILKSARQHFYGES